MGKLRTQIFERIAGFTPSATLILGTGTSREDWKSLMFQQRKGLTPSAIVKPKDLAQLFVPNLKGRLLQPIARQELLRQAFRDPHLKLALSQLRENRFRPRFFDLVDRSLQQGRMRFTNAAELETFQSVLDQKTGTVPKRDEYFLLNRYWTRLLEVRELWDDARLFEVATQKLDEPDAETRDVFLKPELSQLYYVQHTEDLPRVQAFFDALSRRVPLVKVSIDELFFEARPKKRTLNRRLAHSIEDAALFLMDEIKTTQDLDRIAVVIEDDAVVRRTLKRVAEQRGIPFRDSRDPMQVVVDEQIKVALLDLELVAKGFAMPQALEWLRLSPFAFEGREQARQKILDHGVASARKSHAELQKAFEYLEKRFTSRMSLPALHRELLKTCALHELSPQVQSFLDRLFQEWIAALEPVGMAHRKLPLRYWHEQVGERLLKTRPQVDPYRFRKGLQLFRVDQAVQVGLDPEKTQVYFFGISSNYFDPPLRGEDWFTPTELEILSREFSIPGRSALQEQNVRSFCSWLEISGQTPVSLEFLHQESGAEIEPIDFALGAIDSLEFAEPTELGAHPLHLSSLQAQRLRTSEQVRASLPERVWPISMLHSYSNCPFTAYAAYLLNIKDEEDPDFDLSAPDRGSLIHAALEKLVGSQVAGGGQLKKDLTSAEAFDLAWAERRPKGWIPSERIRKAIREQVIELLDRFLQSEALYRTQSGAEPAHVELEVKVEFDGVNFRGRADRIDQHADGLVLIDYKTSSQVMSGGKSLEQARALQLPVYALALRKQLHQEMVAAYYLQLASKQVTRSYGIFFQRWNKGKKADEVEHPLSTLKSNSSSLFQEEPESVWNQFGAVVMRRIQSMKAGDFSAVPSDPSECATCRYRTVCGVTRRISAVADGIGE